MEYTNNDDAEDDNIIYSEIHCNYVTADERRPQSDGISAMCFNIQSMNTKWDRFTSELISNNLNYNIMGFCETHLIDSTETLYTLDGYELFTSNIASNKGGVCLYAQQNLNSKIRDDLIMMEEYIETIFIDCVVDKKIITVGMIYHRPGSSNEHFLQALEIILAKINYTSIVMGDFNINLLNNANTGMDLVNCFKQYSFIPTITKPTRVTNDTATLIDHIWTNCIDHHTINSDIILTDISDHFPVVMHLPTVHRPSLYKTITYRKSGDEYDTIFREKVSNHDFNELVMINDVNVAFQTFSNIIYTLYDESYPEVVKNVKIFGVKNPWLTSAIRPSIKNKNKLYKKFLRRPITLGVEYRRYRNILSRVIRSSKNLFYEKKFNECKGNSKQTWKNLNQILGKSKQQQPKLMKINNTLTDDCNEIANSFNNYYSNIATSVTNNLPNSMYNHNHFLPPRLNTRINFALAEENEIKRIVEQLNDVKAGPDKIPISIIKKNIDLLCPILKHLCNLSLSNGVFPTIHKKGIIIPIYKSKDKYDIANYRPICLLNSCSKILEKLMSIRLISHLENNNLLSNSQFAYRRRRGTDIATAKFVHDVLRGFDDGNITIAVFLDLTKAFD